MSRTQVGGDHYKKLGIPPFEYSMANGLDAMQHTAVKYITRFRDKNGIIDLEKARDTIDQLIAYENNRLGGNVPKSKEPFPKKEGAPDIRIKKNIPITAPAMASLLASISKADVASGLDRIVAIPRGGLSVAHIIAEYLNIKEIELYDPNMVYEGNVLLIDDINDSGDTLIEILNNANRFVRGRVLTAVLAQRHSSKLSADFIGEIINHDEYVLFPWEMQSE